MVKKRMRALRFDNDTIKAVARLVELHMRFYGYRESGWTDSAVRRYVRDVGDQLERLHRVSRSDVTTVIVACRARWLRRWTIWSVVLLSWLLRRSWMRSVRTWMAVRLCRFLVLRRARWWVRPYKFLLNLRLDEGSLPEEEAKARLLQWWGAASGGVASVVFGTALHG